MQADEAKVAAKWRLFQQRHVSDGRVTTERELCSQHPSPKKISLPFIIVRPTNPKQTKVTFNQTNAQTKTTPAKILWRWKNKLANGTRRTETLTWEEEKINKRDEMGDKSIEMWHCGTTKSKSQDYKKRKKCEKSKTWTVVFFILLFCFEGRVALYIFDFLESAAGKYREKKRKCFFFLSEKRQFLSVLPLPASSCHHEPLHHSCVHSERLFSPQQVQAKYLNHEMSIMAL